MSDTKTWLEPVLTDDALCQLENALVARHKLGLDCEAGFALLRRLVPVAVETARHPTSDDRE